MYRSRLRALLYFSRLDSPVNQKFPCWVNCVFNPKCISTQFQAHWEHLTKRVFFSQRKACFSAHHKCISSFWDFSQPSFFNLSQKNIRGRPSRDNLMESRTVRVVVVVIVQVQDAPCPPTFVSLSLSSGPLTLTWPDHEGALGLYADEAYLFLFLYSWRQRITLGLLAEVE